MIFILEKILKNRIVLIIILIVLTSIILYFFNNKEDKVIASTSTAITKKEIVSKNDTKPTSKDIYVEVKGAVNSPGVYSLKENSRVIDAIKLSGGIREDANTDYINQSKILEDQMVIKVYTQKEVEDANKVEIITKYVEKECECDIVSNDVCLNSDTNITMNDIKSTNTSNNKQASNSDLVNINNCTLEELLTLPGIGESKALAILEYKKNKKFEKIEDIKNVTGIGSSLYEKIKDYIEV